MADDNNTENSTLVPKPNIITGNLKAWLAFAIAILGAIQVGLVEDGLSPAEVVGALVTGLVALGGVYQIKNVGQENAQAVVDEVRSLVSDDVKAAIDEIVPGAAGTLKTVK